MHYILNSQIVKIFHGRMNRNVEKKNKKKSKLAFNLITYNWTRTNWTKNWILAVILHQFPKVKRSGRFTNMHF